MTTQFDFEALSQDSEQTLLEAIGAAVAQGPEARAYSAVADGLGARLSRAQRMRALGDKWVANNRDLLHRGVCENDVVRKTLSSDPGVTIEGFKLLVDTFAALHVYVPAGSLAVLVMRKGLDWICPPIV
jgi:hypothetical protein